MGARRNWYFSTLAIAALLFGLDAAAQKYGHGVPKFPDFKMAGPEFRGPPAGVAPGLAVKGAAPGLDGNMPATSNRGGNSGGAPAFKDAPGHNGTMPVTLSRDGESRGSSNLSDPPGQGGAMPAKSNKGGGHDSAPGKDKPDAPGENIQVNAGDVIPQAKPLREIPTCR